MSSKYLDKSEKARRELIDQLQFLGQMGSTETALFHQRAAEIFGLGITDVKAVSSLMQENSMTAGQLAKRLSVTTGAVTSLIDRLETRGIVKRSPDPKDRRKVIVEINTEAMQQDDNIYESMGKAYIKLLSTYSTEELKMLVEYHKKSIKMTKQEIMKLAKNTPKNKLN